MRNNQIYKITVALVGAAITITVGFPDIAFAARDLTSAAQSAVSMATTIARTASVLGIVCGSLIYQIPGATQFARGTIIGGLIGAALSFGGPSIIGFFQTVLGG